MNSLRERQVMVALMRLMAMKTIRSIYMPRCQWCGTHRQPLAQGEHRALFCPACDTAESDGSL